MTNPVGYEKQPDLSADANLLSFVPNFYRSLPVFLTSLLVVWLAIVFPWGGGPVPTSFVYLFYLTVAVSMHAFGRAYSEILKRGLSGFDLIAWVAAIFVTIGVSVDIILFGANVIQSPVTFLGSMFITLPIVFLALVAFQAFYFLVESVVVSLSPCDERNHMTNWYLAMYLFILSINSAAVFTGLLILGYYRAIW
ncbi:MAG: hypothetical protein WAV50_01070 [Minisyncoccia bacterium]